MQSGNVRVIARAFAMRPNWFFAFPIRGDLVGQLPPLPVGFRRFHPDDLHLTIAFLGQCGESGAQRALEALDGLWPILKPKPLAITLGAVTPMGPKSRYTALAALVAEGRAEATHTLALVRDTLTQAALHRRERRPPKPHVTLARPGRTIAADQREAGLVWAQQVQLNADVHRLDTIALYTWCHSRRHRLFRIVAERTIAAERTTAAERSLPERVPC